MAFQVPFLLALQWGAVVCLATPALKQEMLLVITRHGIRVPFPPLDGLPYDVYSLDPQRKWYDNASDWGASQTAELTVHGERVIQEMGAHFRETLWDENFGDFTVYSCVDSTKRDIKTAINFFRGAHPAANVTEQSMYGPRSLTEQAYLKTLMNQGEANGSGPTCIDSGSMRKVIEGENGGNLVRVAKEQEVPIMMLNKGLDCCAPQLCAHEVNSSFAGNCSLMSLPSKWEGERLYWEDFTGPLTVAGKIMEYLQLLYLNGMEWKASVPDMSEGTLAYLMRLHERSVGLASEYWNSLNLGSELLVHLAATMQQLVSGESIEGLHSKPTDTLVYYATHDINIDFLRQLLRLNWLTDSYNPNQVPPGAMLIFALYSSPSSVRGSGGKDYYVKAFFMTQSMDQQRHREKLSSENAASRVFVVIPGCASGPELSCPFEDFKRLVLQESKRECVTLVNPDVLNPTVPEVVVV